MAPNHASHARVTVLNLMRLNARCRMSLFLWMLSIYSTHRLNALDICLFCQCFITRLSLRRSSMYSPHEFHALPMAAFHQKRMPFSSRSLLRSLVPMTSTHLAHTRAFLLFISLPMVLFRCWSIFFLSSHRPCQVSQARVNCRLNILAAALARSLRWRMRPQACLCHSRMHARMRRLPRIVTGRFSYLRHRRLRRLMSLSLMAIWSFHQRSCVSSRQARKARRTRPRRFTAIPFRFSCRNLSTKLNLSFQARKARARQPRAILAAARWMSCCLLIVP
mmetsp:Transcript_37651/g.106378  ORF Transcript_37651/g.106378 Transcript_37651/m.106378 type:complete len:277 (+) Transcript_37651:1350-2180(+)